MPRTCKKRQKVWSDYYDREVVRCKKWRCEADPKPKPKPRRKNAGGKKGRR